MTHLKRLEDEPGARGERAREVLSDERWAEPPPRAEDEIWSRLHLALPIAPLPGAPATPDGGALGGAGGAASTAPAAAGPIAGLGAAAGTAGSSVFLGGAVAKTLLISALVAGGGAVGWQLLPPPRAHESAPIAASATPTPAPDRDPPASRPPAPLPSEVAVAPVAAREHATRSRSGEPAPLGDAVAAEPPRAEPLPVGVAALPDAPAEPAPPAVGATDTRLSEESALLTGARAALREGSLAAATRHLDAHRRRFPSGRLVQEREALRIEVLHQSGHAAAAAQRLEDYARRYPGSPHAARLEQLVDGDGGTAIGK